MNTGESGSYPGLPDLISIINNPMTLSTSVKVILGPGESLDIPFEVVVKKLPAQLEMGLVQINLMDASHVGEQGKQQYWKKMTIPADEMQMRMKNE